jgi:hypothetical protein
MIVYNAANNPVVGLPPHPCIAANIAMPHKKAADAFHITELHVSCPLSDKFYQGEQLGLYHQLQNTFMAVVVHTNAHI